MSTELVKTQSVPLRPRCATPPGVLCNEYAIRHTGAVRSIVMNRRRKLGQDATIPINIVGATRQVASFEGTLPRQTSRCRTPRLGGLSGSATALSSCS